ncbi:UDP-N-acetylmuramoyl-L-alanyl-D-glutamate--2,6-diaminopimelate ligase [Thermonema rossianum]|uniref:UDP-N-acetylmuramoyl-L-alanyl-D-glutamate--2, 6-diaminopimelate ligase n=1 Tax=Thermonema rossianum TaxID=55505 RepID=UPI00056FCBB3|nr:UDP-N-acetylmuramoyl-L-alanyl-D-glutamate--2,6-diaminopimelate ligase [Thermonema rossianum]
MTHILSELLSGIKIISATGDMHVPVADLAFDSRKVLPGTLFVAVRGTQTDGHQYIGQALAAGARAVVCEALPAELHPSVTYVQVEDSAEALGLLAANFYGRPSEKLKVVGITGTNGKTTTATLLYRLFMAMGYRVGLISTVVNRIGEEELPATHTTPDALSVQALLAKMQQAGCTHVFMEVSSHALDQRRVAGLRFTGGVFTNISRDHLDYHKTFEAYIRAKQRLFNDLPAGAFALSNRDDKRGEYMLQNTRAQRLFFALKRPADFKGRILENTIEGLHMEINGIEAWFRLTGAFNAYNLTAVAGTAVALGEPIDVVIETLSGLKGAPGRFETFESNGITAIVDYAHTPDALANVLQTIRELRVPGQRIITVVGCGGNRDKGKRPLMGAMAAQMSDYAIFTSDNPRYEQPMDIIRDMLEGVGVADRKKVIVIEERRAAIREAIQMAQRGDIVLVAGKGHEPYQEIEGVKHPFDDRQEVQAAFAMLQQ